MANSLYPHPCQTKLLPPVCSGTRAVALAASCSGAYCYLPPISGYSLFQLSGAVLRSHLPGRPHRKL